MKDPVSPELRIIEKEIDSYYMHNPLVNLPFARACWYYLAFFEDIPFLSMIRNKSFSFYEQTVHVDNHIFDMQYSIRWLFSSCAPGGIPSLKQEGEYYFASGELSNVAHNYDYFCAAYTLASRNLIRLDLKDNTIFPVAYTNDLRYDAYDLLLKPTNQILKVTDFSMIEGLNDLIRKVLTVSKTSFHYQRSKSSY